MTANEQTRWHQIRGIFEDACEADPDKRRALVAQRCNGDQQLCNEVEQLLALRHEPDLALDRRPVPSVEQQEFAAKAAREAASSPQQTQPRYHDDDLIGGRYRIVAFLARGGRGEVYEGFDEEENRSVALKFVRKLPTGQDVLESRFLREVRMARKIEHPNVCRIFDLSEHEGERFCAMELLRGETLAARLNRDVRIAPSEVLPIARQICDGLSAAHQSGVLHRDLKPGNIFLVGDRAVIFDFGLATAALRDTTSTDATCTEPSLTATGAVIGTLAYMAPVQLEERGGGIQVDIYSLGVIFFEMLTGDKPHDAKSPFLLAAQKARESHRAGSGSAGSGVPGMPPVWQEVITRSLKARPEDRYASQEELKLALERGRPSRRFVLTQPRVFFPALAAMLAIVAWIGWSWARKDHVPPPQAQKFYEQAYEAMTLETAVAGAA